MAAVSDRDGEGLHAFDAAVQKNLRCLDSSHSYDCNRYLP